MATHAIHSFYKGFAEYFTPVLQKSNFKEKGVLTPEEFVQAGDQLVFKCRTWQWAPGKEGLTKPYLPKDKQFLITRNVPSLKRATDYALHDAKEAIVEGGEDGKDGWVSTHIKDTSSTDTSDAKRKEEEFETIDGPNDTVETKTETDAKQSHSSNNTTTNDDDSANNIAAADNTSNEPMGGGDGDEEDEEIPDMDDFEDDNLVETDPGMLLTNNIIEASGESSGAANGDGAPIIKSNGGILRVSEPEDNIERTRTYDISITYDKYYRTPRIFLFGYDQDRQPLSTKQIMEDISADHAHKTVTVDPHPHLEVPHASIHPCKHAPVMLRICERMEEENLRKLYEAKVGGAKKRGLDLKPEDIKPSKEEAQRAAIQVSQYLFLFLKFISSVIPTIEYDYTF
eukprot:CAMPEP_0197527336 /NCGR_PEP_ID=MMETSP1318-20131121/21133_1 /TAXON_ID=552666 /ORGANISM="Partenskyella glossopodia, Strain RCC365" /LENGTH=397 /DNA_ID=CAMNT_0043081909 /DNA_START=34 /DNA_END=1227 /DNA_ORIENTATION=+